MKIQIPFEILLFLKRISPVSDPKLQRRVNFLPNVITSIFPRKISSQLFNATRRRHRDLFPAHPLESLLLSATHSSHPPLPPPITDLSLSLYPMLGGIEPRSLTVPSYPPRRNPLSPLFSLSSSSLSSPHALRLHLRIFVAVSRSSLSEQKRGGAGQRLQLARESNVAGRKLAVAHVRSWTEGRMARIRPRQPRVIIRIISDGPIPSYIFVSIRRRGIERFEFIPSFLNFTKFL